MHILHVICMLSAHVHVLCLSSLTLLVYPIIHNLVSVHIVFTHAHCQYHVYIVYRCMLCISHFYCCYFSYVHVIHILSEHLHIMHTLFAVVLDIFLPNRQCQCHPYVISSTLHVLCTCHLYCCYLYMYMYSTYSLGIYILCAHYLKWSLISSFLTDNTNVIHTSSLVVFIYFNMDNMLSAPLPDDMSSTPLLDDMSAPLPNDMSSAPLPDDMSSTPLQDDMSSALQRNMSYLFEV